MCDLPVNKQMSSSFLSTQTLFLKEFSQTLYATLFMTDFKTVLGQYHTDNLSLAVWYLGYLNMSS